MAGRVCAGRGDAVGPLELRDLSIVPSRRGAALAIAAAFAVARRARFVWDQASGVVVAASSRKRIVFRGASSRACRG